MSYFLFANFSFPIDQVLLVKFSYLFLKLLIVMMHLRHLFFKIYLNLCQLVQSLSHIVDLVHCKLLEFFIFLSKYSRASCLLIF